MKSYPYYQADTRGVQFAAMKAALAALPAGEVVLLHGCCHNPTGADIDASQWREVVAVCSERGLVPLVDLAYQGFADGIEADALCVRLLAEAGHPFLVASSFSKSLSLYGERVGALCVVATSKDEAARVLSQVKRLVRTNYSNPPTHGAAVVSAVLSSPELRELWERELAGMRDRIRAMREGLLQRLRARHVKQDLSFIVKQRGLFSYTGLTPAQVERLKSELGSTRSRAAASAWRRSARATSTTWRTPWRLSSLASRATGGALTTLPGPHGRGRGRGRSHPADRRPRARLPGSALPGMAGAHRRTSWRG